MRLVKYFISVHLLKFHDQTPSSMITAMPQIQYCLRCFLLYLSLVKKARRQTGSSCIMAVPWLTQWI